MAAHWWKAQVNLNAKAPAFAATLPELTHDELAGWGQGGDVTRQTMSLVLLRHAGEAPRTAGQFDAVRAATDEVMADVFEVRGRRRRRPGPLLRPDAGWARSSRCTWPRARASTRVRFPPSTRRRPDLTL